MTSVISLLPCPYGCRYLYTALYGDWTKENVNVDKYIVLKTSTALKGDNSFRAERTDMEIRAGRYILRSDRYCCWIDEEYESEQEKSKGKIMTRQVAGYCIKFDKLLNDFIDRAVNSSDATSMAEILDTINKATKDAKKIAQAAYKGDFSITRTKGEGK